ncbi:hypothetical protein EMA8858_00696 [Emticicia aquatica]|jgi:uncharacterized protein (DUF2141 family)|uniref:DUF2141 domain-containing protein n=1 Tax=Emticicia aquatica TaxID=1681835 RepID=A0ABM9AM16_9BACT|nr:DUF2141 domain-containing protein [Emticicia aquatica]CAH0994586.1 hypothetical protein EMA8858_00696 [Emticicia aquatica]
MKKILFLFFFANVVVAQKFTLKVSVVGFENNQGKLFFQLLDAKEKIIKQSSEVIDNKQVVIETKDLLAGKYVVKVFQDENNNKKLDTGMFGIPKEPWGLSNNIKAVLGPPKWDDMIFEIKANKEISIKLH